jgi:hypothetical protein
MSERISLTREQYVDSIGHLTAAANGLAARLTMSQLTWQPKSGAGWSVVECLDHLAIATDVYLDAMEQGIAGARPGGPEAAVLHTHGWFSTKMVGDLEPPVRSKFPAPGKIRPRPTLIPEGILPQFLKAMNRASTVITNTAGKDLNSVRFRNPLIPVLRFTVATGFLIIAAHGRRHLWQAEQVAQEADFPR